MIARAPLFLVLAALVAVSSAGAPSASFLRDLPERSAFNVTVLSGSGDHISSSLVVAHRDAEAVAEVTNNTVFLQSIATECAIVASRDACVSSRPLSVAGPRSTAVLVALVPFLAEVDTSTLQPTAMCGSRCQVWHGKRADGVDGHVSYDVEVGASGAFVRVAELVRGDVLEARAEMHRVDLADADKVVDAYAVNKCTCQSSIGASNANEPTLFGGSVTCAICKRLLPYVKNHECKSKCQVLYSFLQGTCTSLCEELISVLPAQYPCAVAGYCPY